MTNEDFQKLVIEQLTKINTRLDNIETDVSEIKTDVSNLEGQMAETNQIVKAVRHNTEFISAEVNGLKVTTANLEAVKRTEKMLTIMNAISQVENNIRDDMKSLFEIAGEHEVKIRTLSRRPV